MRDGAKKFTEPSMRVAALVNPQARKGEFLRRWPDVRVRIEAALGISPGSLEVLFSTEQSHGAEQVREALRSGVRRIIAVGGDGTISEAVQGFFGPDAGDPIASEARLAVFPAGRGNDFFRTVRGARSGLERVDAEAEALKLLGSGEARPYDLLKFELFSGERRVDARYSINLASFGLSGAIVGNIVDPSHLLNQTTLVKTSFVYALHTALELRRFRRQHLRVRGEGASGAIVWEGGMTEGAVVNSRFNAGGAQWFSGASPEDGGFELLILAPETHVGLLKLVPRLLTGEWNGSRGAHVFPGLTKVELVRDVLDAEKGPWIEIDGELVTIPGVTAARVTLVPGVINVWSRPVPAEGVGILR